MNETEAQGRPVAIEAEGAVLSGRFFAAQGAARANLVLHGATGVPQRYYAAFARWAAASGVGVLTYDYRDFGDSVRGPLVESPATMADWGVLDQGAAERALAALASEGPLWIAGHSLGGLTFAFRRHDARVTQVTTIGAGFAHVMDHPWSYRPLALAFWYGIGPVATRLAGYLPGRRVLFGADLPAGVYWQWRRWCTRRDFFDGDIGRALPANPAFGRVPFRLRMLGMEDDAVVPPAAVWRYADRFPAAAVERRVLRPRDFGVPSLRHIQVFSARNAAAWPALLGDC